MSRVGRKPVAVPPGIRVEIKDGEVRASGPKGALTFEASSHVSVAQDGDALIVTPADRSRMARALWGTTRSRLANMIRGVAEGFERRLLISGVGYRATTSGSTINLSLGFSHPVQFELPEGVSVRAESATELVLAGADRQQVGQVAANIRKIRPPEPYKGKGVRYAEEYVVRKEGKKK